MDRVTGVQTCYNHANSGLSDQQVNAVAIDPGGNKWIGTGSQGLAKFDGSGWACYNITNSGIPSNSITAVTIDGNGTKWIGTSGGGLAKYDGTTWVVFNTSNSGISSNYLKAVFIDLNGIKWISTDAGISKFDGTTWTVYNTANSGLPGDMITYIIFDDNNNLWVVVPSYGIVKYDGVNWTMYNSSNSGLPNNWVGPIAIDSSGNIWIGSSIYWGGGLTKFDGTTWTTYGISNSGLSGDPSTIAIDESGNKWIAAWGGLYVFNENGLNTIFISDVTSTNVTTNGGNDGTITVIAGGGTAPLQYSTDNGMTWQYDSIFTGLTAGDYYVVVKDANNLQVVYSQNPVTIEEPAVGLEAISPGFTFTLYPNPVSGNAVFSFHLESRSKVTLDIYDCTGNKTCTLINRELPAGDYQFPFNGTGQKSGVYYYQIKYYDTIKTGKMMVL